MRLSKPLVRAPLVGGVFLAAGLAALAISASQLPEGKGPQRGAGPVEQRDAEPRLKLGDDVGRITRLSPGRVGIRIDFGRESGAEVGMSLRVRRCSPDRTFLDLGWLGVTEVGERESVARIVESRAEEHERVFRRKDAELEMRPGDTIVYATDDTSLQLVKWADSDAADAVPSLLGTRVELARRRLDMAWAFASEGSVAMDRYIEASRALMNAERDAATTREGEVAAIRAQMSRMRRLVEREANNFVFERGVGSVLAEEEARCALADAALMLARTKPGAPRER